MVNDRFAQLMARKFSGEASEAEVRELDILLKDDPQSQYFFEIFSDYWKLQSIPEEDVIQEDVHFQQILAIAEKGQEDTAGLMEPAKEPARLFTLRKLLVAATIIGLIACVYFLIPFSKSAPVNGLSFNEVVVAKPGSKLYMLLPDGSKVWLNSESKLEYKKKFNDSIREVTLEGEGFFEVVKDKKHPFIVHTSDIDIKVLGTAFNVKSYPKESYIETTLLRGLIEVTNKNDPSSPKVLLYPHDKLVFNRQVDNPGRLLKPKNEEGPNKFFEKIALSKNIADSALVETSWMYNKLLFDGESLRQNAAKMERWYNVNIRFKDEKAGNTPIRYPLSNETIEEALKALQYVEPFNYRIIGNEIEIWRKKN